MKERRRHPRLKEETTVDVTILSAPDSPARENRTFTCSTLDMSLHGMRLSLDQEVPVGGALELRLSSRNPTGTFWHIGRVRWLRRSERDKACHLVGLQFTQTPEATLVEWEKSLRAKLERAGNQV